VPDANRIDAALSCNGELQDKLEAPCSSTSITVSCAAAGATFTQYGSVVLPHRWTTPT